MASSILLLRNGTVLFHETDGHVRPLFKTDILIQASKIVKIGTGLTVPDGKDVEVVDCTDKIISPGFIDTHHHLWQAQLKGVHGEHTLIDYFADGEFHFVCGKIRVLKGILGFREKYG